jgi:hypothetical protein
MVSESIVAGKEALAAVRQLMAKEKAAIASGTTPEEADFDSKLAAKVVMHNLAKKYDVTQKMVREAMLKAEEDEEAAQYIAEADEYKRQEEIKNSKWLTFYWNKWRPIPFVFRFAIVFAVISIFPPLTMAVVVWLGLVYFRFRQENPNHWTNGIADTAATGIVAARVYGEYKKFRDGPKK